VEAAAREAGGGVMTPPAGIAGQIIGILLVLASLVGGGVVIGRQSRDDDVKQLTAERDAALLHANAQAETLATIKATLREERERRNRIEQAAQQELAARADRIAQLEVAAARRRQTLTAEASKHEDCNALRLIPVCAALSDGLYGRPPAAGAH